MKDGSDAVSDWPLLNALLNTAGGATWVSLHHGGGVGMGYSQHSGVVIVCDGTDAAAKRIERVLWNDPATGVMRHADAGYDSAVACAKAAGPEPADDRSLILRIRPGHFSLDQLHSVHARRRRAADRRQRARRHRRQRGGGAARGRRQRAGVWRQHRLRQAGVHPHQRSRPGDAAAEPDPLAQRRRRRAAGARSGAAGAGPQGGVAGARRLRRAPSWSSTRCWPCSTPAWCPSSLPGFGRRLGRPGAAGAHDAGAAGRRRVPGRRRAPRRGRGAARSPASSRWRCRPRKGWR